MSKLELVEKPVVFSIDGIEVVGKKGETILEVARRYGIYIPTLCYLPKLKPIASCRLCIVEVEGQSGFVLSCQTPAIDGIKVVTNSEALFSERQKIMKLYNLNHPLECGVCDKSGECELQNKTLEFEVNSQEFAAKEHKRELANWGLISYDESLCILCERCVHTCNEIIGDDAIELKVGGYSSKIGPKNSPSLDCTFCGECVAVCPVGALTATHFKYTTNAWELNRIPAKCPHCSSACEIFYEVKQNRIYRVTNDFYEKSICGAARFGFDSKLKPQLPFNEALDALKRADTIIFDSYITNEEALILQKLKEKFGYKLYNPDALAFKRFLDAFSTVSAKKLYEGKLDSIKEADFILVIGSLLSTDAPAIRYALTNARQLRGAKIAIAHPIEDPLLKTITALHLKYEVGTEEGLLALLAKAFIKEQVGALNRLDVGYLSAESNIGEEEIAKVAKLANNSKNRLLIVGPDIYAHKRANKIAKIIGAIERFTDIKVLLIPSQTNTLGVSLICDLDEVRGNSSVGINVDADVRLDFAPIAYQEGTLVDINKRVVPTNAAATFNGYTLLELAKALGVTNKRYTVEFTKELFEKIGFDSLPSCGYELTNQKIEATESIDEVAELPEYNGVVIYLANPVLQFNRVTATSSLLPKESYLRGTSLFAQAAKISDGDRVVVSFENREFETTFKIDPKLKGTIAILATFDKEGLDGRYRFIRCNITKRIE